MDLVYIYPGGVRTGSHLFLFGKSAFLKHPNVHVQNLESVDCGDTGEFDELGNSGKYGS